MLAFALRLSGLRAVTRRCAQTLGTSNFSSLCHALRRCSALAFLWLLIRHIEGQTPWDRKPVLAAIDSMAVTLPRTRRHRCKKSNNATVGGGVVWAYLIDAAKGISPVKVLKLVEGAWHDTTLMRGVELIAHGPIYLMDRGFYAFDLLQSWLKDGVRFIVRVREHDLLYEPLRTLSSPRRIGNQWLKLDSLVRLGGPKAKLHPVVRLIMAQLATGESLILATDRIDWSVEQVLAAYRKRWHIERFHRFLKDTLGLAHLYSFDQSGIAFLTLTALLVALLLFLAATAAVGQTIVILRAMLKVVRAAVGLDTPWKRNTYARRRTKKMEAGKRRNH